MSYANGTTHFNLPQTVGTDKRDWFDTNEPFAAIDAALQTAVDTCEANQAAITELQTDVQGLTDDMASRVSEITALQTRVSATEQSIVTLNTELADARQDFKDAICTYDEGTATASTRAYAVGDYFWYNDTLYKATAVIAVGDAIVPNTNCVTTTITEEIKALA